MTPEQECAEQDREDELRRAAEERPERPGDAIAETIGLAVSEALARGEFVAQLAERGWALVHVGDGTCPEPSAQWLHDGIDITAQGWIDPMERLHELWRSAWEAGRLVGSDTQTNAVLQGRADLKNAAQLLRHGRDVLEWLHAEAVWQRDEALAALEKQQAVMAKLDRDIDDELGYRDSMEEWADKLAYAVAPVEVIGEHSNANNPWQNALEILNRSGYVPAMLCEAGPLTDLPTTGTCGGGDFDGPYDDEPFRCNEEAVPGSEYCAGHDHGPVSETDVSAEVKR
ncbi:hypothetical protein [Lentzea sp. NPDC092896]|uniref:hypothetical protein n=1 Tax=Lentzea sp. NPDC092896 TaxID=3364127 RepID=UPI003816F618